MERYLLSTCAMLQAHFTPRIGIPLVAATLATLVTTGCGPFGTSGALGNGGFTYDCIGNGDAFCEGLVPPLEGFSGLPARIAVGGTFNMAYNGEKPETSDGIEFQVTIVPASTKVVDVVSGVGFRVTSAGQTAFLARGANGVVADFVHVLVADTDHLEVSAGGAALTKLDLTTSTQENLRVQPLNANNDTLAGNLEYNWSSSDESIVSILANDNDATAQGVAAGMATITVNLGSISLDLPVTVQATP
jgi:hypothetical protein